jgi:hypothetical protein
MLKFNLTNRSKSFNYSQAHSEKGTYYFYDGYGDLAIAIFSSGGEIAIYDDGSTSGGHGVPRLATYFKCDIDFNITA